MELNVANLIAEQAAAAPNRAALVHEGRSWSFGELLARADQVAARLRALLEGEFARTPVPRVGLFCPNGPGYVALALGILRAGACLVPVAPELTPAERSAQIALTAQHLVIAAGPHPWLPGPGQAERSDGVEWSWTRLEPQAAFPEERFAALRPAFVRFSSGTTGTSKGVVLGHESLLARVRSANRRLQIGPADRVLWTLPMAHHFAVSIVLYLLAGATTVLAETHLADELLGIGREAGATVLYGSPFHYQLLASEESGRDWPTLRLAVATAAALREDTARAFEKRYGLPLCQGLGIIEAGLPLLNTADPLGRPLSVGRPDDIAVSLRGPDGVPAQSGELFLRGPGMFDAYLLPWQEREAVAPGGWFATGDLGWRDAEGFIFLSGRSKSVINVGGMKVFPEEIEAVLNSHPAVLESRVSGEPHERWEMVPVAELIPRDPARPPSAAALARHCREALSAYKVPLRFRCVEALPRTASGKLRR